VVVQTGYMSYHPAVQALEAAVHSDKFTEIQWIAMSSNYSFTDISELVIYRLVADVPTAECRHRCRSCFWARRYNLS
jgi:hypothetical protein